MRFFDVILPRSTTIKSRIFLVGCARSGTTLCQSMLMGHSAVQSFPETHFFEYGIDSTKARVFGAAYTSYILYTIQKALFTDHSPYPYISLSKKKLVKMFVDILDYYTFSRNKTIWVEKTPAHLHSIDYIKKCIPSARFIHIVRDGRAVVASLHDASRKYPQFWNGVRSVEQCVDEWNICMGKTARYKNHPDHYIISYEKIIDNACLSISQLCSFLGVPFEQQMIDNFSVSAKSVITSDEAWKNNNVLSLINTNLDKYNLTFDTEQKKLIESTLHFELYNYIIDHY